MKRKFLVYLLPFLISCTSTSDIENQTKLNYFHFGNYLFETDSATISLRKGNWERELGGFASSFDYQIMKKTYNDEEKYQQQLLSFVSDSIFREANDSIKKKFGDFSNLENQLNSAFSLYHFYFPENSLPKIITMFSGFTYGVVAEDTILAIGLDFFLGKNSKFYNYLQDPEYMKFQKQPRFILPSCMEVWCNHDFGQYDNGNNLLARMIYKGKLMYFIDKMLPEFSRADKLRFSGKQLKWCNENEHNIWTYLIDNDLLFSTQENKFRSYLNYAPFAKGMPKESPARITYFIGYTIVSLYMNRNPQLTIEDLMQQTNEQLILKESKYKPSN